MLSRIRRRRLRPARAHRSRDAPQASVAVVAIPAMLAVAVAACGDRGPGAATDSTTTTAPTAVASSAVETTSGEATTTAPPTTAATTTTAVTTTTAPGFEAAVLPVGAELRAQMDGVSMHPGCPVGFDDLAHVRVTHLDMGGAVRTGELVVHADVADDVVSVFGRLFDAGFPIHSMRLVDDFGADDFESIEANNTSAFNCRLRTGSDTEYSQHSYGRAIDLNPIQNPYVSSAGTTSHPASRPYLDRSIDAPGVIGPGGVVVEAFAGIGWTWGGDWTDVRDYQHFSANGR